MMHFRAIQILPNNICKFSDTNHTFFSNAVRLTSICQNFWFIVGFYSTHELASCTYTVHFFYFTLHSDDRFSYG